MPTGPIELRLVADYKRAINGEDELNWSEVVVCLGSDRLETPCCFLIAKKMARMARWFSVASCCRGDTDLFLKRRVSSTPEESSLWWIIKLWAQETKICNPVPAELGRSSCADGTARLLSILVLLAPAAKRACLMEKLLFRHQLANGVLQVQSVISARCASLKWTV